MKLSKNVGGYLRGPWWKYIEDEEKTRRCFVIAWGAVTRAPSEKYDDLRIVRFIIKTGRGAGRNEKYLVCVAYGEHLSSVIVRALELGDIVLCAGTWVETTFRNKKGETKTQYEMRVNFILTLGLIGFLYKLYCLPSLAKAIKEWEEADADVWESDDDSLGL